MYLPQHFAVTDPAVLFDLMQQFSFATLVSVHEGRPFATHIPFTVYPERNLLASHIARANPQWTSFDRNQEVLVIFQGDHSYISPTWYEKHPSVPTWNYMTVHAYGKVQIVEEPTAVKALLHDLVVQYERQWKMEELPPDYLHGMMKGIVAFQIEITKLEGKFKLSQNRSRADRERVIAALEQSPNLDDRAIARQMKKHLEQA
ncbi:FMN-binding negative transcriptional regulator [Meiothermus taiwanensis]|jgi:transcriptional regulator|uniref:Protease synthase and sporulation protein PAI 2 n=2 Tax=Meiothermus taiwanensis TaxID=172827 RepID=A0A399DTQ9_9DEIN|nr:FMN-binding negative transcriptional regulator [Meiothermus taiwanensis]AWR87235.1 FMN-binding negative transcriptional regulator [Meiothermus taiwanensis WR-220]KIQ53343.1 transcriptional regulator [Meiothermus taiwanensis]KZK15350.1 transcriptional regulator [Meiothermus taiwanensis]RIH74823.1 Protease synthase and sporulation protein PAI 2 [Meiothermus taiwanensis]